MPSSRILRAARAFALAIAPLRWRATGAPLPRPRRMPAFHGAGLLAATALLSCAWSSNASAYGQQTINSFSPQSGPVGTVITVNGSGFTGSNQAWIGAAHDAALSVVSDAQVRVTVPAGATSAAIGILSSTNSAFSPTSFTVTAAQPPMPQQTISSFAPASGPVGTVITVTGSGFTGSNRAWVGSGHDATLSVVSATQAKVTVPADGKTGVISILSTQHSVSSSNTFTVTTSTATQPQQTINNFAPASGPVGTVVTVNGSGFTGSNAAWVGSAHNATISVVNDTQVRVTVPAGATDGAIGIFSSQHSAFSPTSFSVTTSAPAMKQQTISSFSPSSGTAGTTISVTGSGFSGSNAAWVGTAQDASLTVLSDTQAKINVPTDAVSGKLKILSTQYSASSSGTFTVTTGSSPPPPPPPSPPPPPAPTPTPTGSLSIHVQGNHFVNGSGAVVQLRGSNYSGYEFAAIQGWSGSDPSGGQAGQPGGPKWSAMQSWKTNTVRVPLNEASWLGYSCTDTSGVVHNPDPAGNYKQSVQTLVSQANAAGIYVILDLHWTAPGNTCPMLQTQMADADHSLAFWTSLANMFKNNPAVLFELFNEPFMNFEFSGDTWAYMMKGTGGSFSGYPATSSSSNWQDIKKAWAIASYQQMIDTVRATGATNVVLVGTMQYAQDLSGWLANRPTDAQGQMAAAWHPYRNYGTAWDYAYPNFYPEVMTDAKNILNAGIPLVMTEVGGQNTAGTPNCPIVTTMTKFADDNGASVIGWTWDAWGDPENVLIKDVDGTPTDGYGQVFRNWMLAH